MTDLVSQYPDPGPHPEDLGLITHWGEVVRVRGCPGRPKSSLERSTICDGSDGLSAYISGHHVNTGGHVTEMRGWAQTVEAIAERLGDTRL